MDVLGRLTLAAFALWSASGCAPGPEPLSEEQVALFAQPVNSELVVHTTRNAMLYETLRIEARAGATVRLVIDNTKTTSPSMIHNVVVVRDDEVIDRVGRTAARERDHIPDDPAILAFTPLAGPGERRAVVFTMPPPGRYPFVCTYPGHIRFMRGTLVSTAS